MVDINLDYLDADDEVAVAVEAPERTEQEIELQIAPCVVLSGLTLEEEVIALKNRVEKGADFLPLYLEHNGEKAMIGKFSINLDNILYLHYMNYEGYLLTPDGSKVDLLDVERTYHFIRL